MAFLHDTAHTDDGAALTFGKGALVSRLLGFARDAAIAALLGGGWLADAFVVAFRLPNFVRRLLAEGAFAYTLVPAYLSLKSTDATRAASFMRSVTLILVVTFGATALTGMVFAKQAALFLAPGLAAVPDVLGMTALFLTLCLPYLPLAAGAAVTSAVLMAEGRFMPSAYSPAVLNVTIIAAVGIAFLVFGPGDERSPYILCAGVVTAGAAQWLFQIPSLIRAGLTVKGPVYLRDEAVSRSLKSFPGSIFGVAGNQVNILLAAFMASFLAEGSISALYFAERLVEFPLGVIGASVGLAALGKLARLTPGSDSSSNGAAAFTACLAKAVGFALFFGLPAAIGTACLALPLTSVVFGYGGFGQEALGRTSAALLAYTVGLPALAMVRPLLAGTNALNGVKSSMEAALAGVVTVLVLGVAALALGVVWGLALAVSLAAWVNAALLLRSLRRRGVLPLPCLAWIGKALTACFFMAICVIQVSSVCVTSGGKVALGVPLGVLVYFIVALTLRIGEAAEALRIGRRLLRKRQP